MKRGPGEWHRAFRATPVLRRMVLLEARGATARYLSEALDQRQWHWQKNDVLAIKLPTSRPHSVVQWAIRQGPDLVIVGPGEVRQLALETLREMRADYSA